MPVDIIATENAPYIVMQEETQVSSHTTERKAIQSAINAAESCSCVVTIHRDLTYTVTYEPPKPVDNGAGTGDCPSPSVVNLQWTPPATDITGVPLDEVESYRIRTVTVGEEAVQEVGGDLSQVRSSPLLPGEYSFYLSAKAKGLWSEEAPPAVLVF